MCKRRGFHETLLSAAIDKGEDIGRWFTTRPLRTVHAESGLPRRDSRWGGGLALTTTCFLIVLSALVPSRATAQDVSGIWHGTLTFHEDWIDGANARWTQDTTTTIGPHGSASWSGTGTYQRDSYDPASGCQYHTYGEIAGGGSGGDLSVDFFYDTSANEGTYYISGGPPTGSLLDGKTTTTVSPETCPLSSPTEPHSVYAGGVNNEMQHGDGTLQVLYGTSGTGFVESWNLRRLNCDESRDSDKDGWPDCEESRQGTDPYDAGGHPEGIPPAGGGEEGGGGSPGVANPPPSPGPSSGNRGPTIPRELMACQSFPQWFIPDDDRDGVANVCDEVSFSPAPRGCKRHAHLVFIVHHSIRAAKADPRPQTNGCWTYNHVANRGGGWSVSRWTREHWVTCGNEWHSPIVDLAPGWWSYEDMLNDTLAFTLHQIKDCAAPGFWAEVRDKIAEEQRTKGRKLSSKEISKLAEGMANDQDQIQFGEPSPSSLGLVHVAFRKHVCAHPQEGRCPKKVRFLKGWERKRIREVAGADAFLNQLYDGRDYPCPKFQPRCSGHPVYTEQLYKAWNAARSRRRHVFGVGVVDITPGWGLQHSRVRRIVETLCEDARADGWLPHTRMLGVFSGKGLTRRTVTDIVAGMNKCTKRRRKRRR